MGKDEARNYAVLPESGLEEGDRGPERREEEDEGGKPAGVTIASSDMYDAVVASAFGGVTQLLAKSGPTLVHPIFLFVLSAPLLVAQASALVYLRLDQDLKAPVNKSTDNPDLDYLLVVLKLLMVIIMQLLLFSKLMSTLRLFVFLMNPLTWEDIERPDPEIMKMRMKVIFMPIFLAPPAILALVLHAIIDYNICIDSVSIILGSRGVKEAIYDSLAITFIADLGSMYWEVLASVFHFQPFNGFEFVVAHKQLRQHVREKAILKIPDVARSYLWFLERGHGARRLEVSTTFLIMCVIYVRQVFVIVQALDTNILPVARDVCTLWRWTGGSGQHPRKDKTAWLFRILETHFLIADPSAAIMSIADPRGDHPGYCNDKYDRLRPSAYLGVAAKHPGSVTVVIVAIIVFLVLPQVYYLAYHLVRKQLYPNEDESEDLLESRASRSSPSLFGRAASDLSAERLQDETRPLKEGAQKHEDEIRGLRSELRGLKEEFGRELQKELRGLKEEFGRELQKEREAHSQEVKALREELGKLSKPKRRSPF